MPDSPVSPADVTLTALRSSVERLHRLTVDLDDAALGRPAYPSEWTIAAVLSHLGSGAVILHGRFDDVLAGGSTPEGFAPGVWDEWNAKAPRAQADDALVTDRALLQRLETSTGEEQARFTFTMGPVELDFARFVALRLNEHAFHTWDIEVALDRAAVLAPAATAVVIDNLGMIARFTGKPTGTVRTITVGTTEPARGFRVDLTAESVTFGAADSGAEPDVELPAEAFARLVYGRLDPAHTPAVAGDAGALDELRRVFPGP